MASIDTVVVVTHLIFAGVWTGSVVFVALWVVPLAREGGLDAAPLGSLAGGLRRVSRISALVLFLTGGHLAGTRYTVDSLIGSTGGWLVLCMLVLWLLLIALVEVGVGRLADGAAERKVREPARAARGPLLAAAAVAVALLVDGGLLTALV